MNLNAHIAFFSTHLTSLNVTNLHVKERAYDLLPQYAWPGVAN
jgi:hypothetical protein